MSVTYNAQDRGTADDYRRYFDAMDASLRLKLATIGAHFLLDPGARIADMGCGSGSGTHQFALLNPQLRVIGIDVNPETIRIARERYRLPNLEFRVGDASHPCFADEPVDGILTSSTLHHLVAFAGEPYDREQARRALAAHLADLREDGALVLRDFVLPDDPHRTVILSLPDEPSRGPAPADLSAADLLLRFSRTARPLDRRQGPGFMIEELDPEPGWRRFRLCHRHAVEFLLRKDYRTDWETELLEEYAYWTLGDAVSALRGLGARVLHAAAVPNPWIVANRFEGQARLHDERGAPLPWPATNMIVAAQKAAAGATLRYVEKRTSATAPSYLHTSAWRDPRSGAVMDLAARPSGVIDALPWRLDSAGRLRVLARSGYPRPLTATMSRGADRLDRVIDSGHQIEPVATPVDGLGPAALHTRIASLCGIEDGHSLAWIEGLSYMPSPGGIAESVRSLWPRMSQPQECRAIPASASGLSRSGVVREFDAQDLLRAAQAGMLTEARLETNILALMRHLGVHPDPWIAEPLPLPVGTPSIRVDAATVLDARVGAPFVPCDGSAGYLRHLRSQFDDQTVEDGLPRTLASVELEFVVPARMTPNTLSVAPLLRDPADGRVLIGIELRDLPAAQVAYGDARLPSVPAWRMPTSVQRLDEAEAHVAERLLLPGGRLVPLGAAYRPSIGVTPEVVHPYVVDGTRITPGWDIVFVPVDDLATKLHDIHDGHLLVSLLRLAHALAL